MFCLGGICDSLGLIPWDWSSTITSRSSRGFGFCGLLLANLHVAKAVFEDPLINYNDTGNPSF